VDQQKLRAHNAKATALRENLRDAGLRARDSVAGQLERWAGKSDAVLVRDAVTGWARLALLGSIEAQSAKLKQAAAEAELRQRQQLEAQQAFRQKAIQQQLVSIRTQQAELLAQS
ncbi:unnamed protein product, partial [Polarella glacialis]